jgi:hypothetical protein
MKKQIKHKKFIIIFVSFVLLLTAVYFGVKAIFPLPPEREMTIEERKIYIDSIEFIDDDIDGIYANFTPYDDESLLVTVPFDYYEDSEIKPYTRIYHITKSGEILGTFDVGFPAVKLYAFEDGNIGFFYHTGEILGDNIYSLREYSPDFKFVSEKQFPEKFKSGYNMVYSHGSFYRQSSGGMLILDRNLNITAEYSVSDPENQALQFCEDADKNQYFYLIENNPDAPYFSTSYYIRPMNGGSDVLIDVPKESIFAVIGGGVPQPGDSEYPFYATLFNDYGFWSYFFDDDIGGAYICGLNTDGSVVTLLSYAYAYEGNMNYNFSRSVPIGDKRYYADTERVHIDRNLYKIDLYLYEYNAYYED